MESEATYNIVYASDENYVSIMATSIVSLMVNNRSIGEIVFYIMADNISAESQHMLESMVKKYNRKIFFINVKDTIEWLKDSGINAFGENQNYTTFLRLFLINKIPVKTEKILYLDCDTLVVDSLENLFSIEMKEAIVAGVKDIVPQYYIEGLGIDRSNYINCGVLLINVAKWKNYGTEDKIINFISKSKRFFWYSDQDVINCVLENKIKIIDLKYDVLSENLLWRYESLKNICEIDFSKYYSAAEYELQRKNPVIIHFVPNILERPWQGGKFLTDKWMYYYNITGFAGTHLMKKKELTNKRKFIQWLYLHFPEKIVSQIYGIKRKKELRERLLIYD